MLRFLTLLVNENRLLFWLRFELIAVLPLFYEAVEAGGILQGTPPSSLSCCTVFAPASFLSSCGAPLYVPLPPKCPFLPGHVINSSQISTHKSASPALGLMHSLSLFSVAHQILSLLSTCTLIGPVTLLRKHKKAVSSALLMVRWTSKSASAEPYNPSRSPISSS